MKWRRLVSVCLLLTLLLGLFLPQPFIKEVEATPDPALTFGKISEGGTDYYAWGDKTYLCRFYLSESGNVTAFKILSYAIPAVNVKPCIYNDSGGAPNGLMWNGSAKTISGGKQWHGWTNLNFSLEGSQYYWLGVKGDSTQFRLYYDGGSTDQFAYKAENYTDPFSDPFGTPDGYSNYDITIYCEYTNFPPEYELLQFSHNGTNPNIPIKFYCHWTDKAVETAGLSGFIFSNRTYPNGSWENETWSDPWTGTPTEGWSNVTKDLSGTPNGTIFEYKFYCNDTDNHWTETKIKRLVLEPFVVVQNGHFYKYGQRINFVGGVVMANTTGGSQDLVTEETIKMLARSGGNLIRLWTNFNKLMPTYGTVSSSHLELLQTVVNWCTDYKIYVAFCVSPYSNNWYDEGNDHQYWYYYNETVTKAYEWSMGNISATFKNEPYVLGNVMPYWEHYFETGTLDGMSGNDWATGNITVMWNKWLKNRYDNVTALNATWNQNTWSQLNASETTILTDWGDSQSNGILTALHITNRVEHHWYDNRRLPDWHNFLGDWYYNYSSRVNDYVKAIDANHLILGSFASYPIWWKAYAGYPMFCSLPNQIPSTVDALTGGGYISNDEDEYRFLNLMGGYGDDWADLPANRPIINFEQGLAGQSGGDCDYPYPWADAGFSQLAGVPSDGVTFYQWAYGGTDYGNGHPILKTQSSFCAKTACFPYWTEAYKAVAGQVNPKVLMMGYGCYSYLERWLKYFFGRFNVQWAYAPTTVGKNDPSIISNGGWDTIILQLGDNGQSCGVSKETLIKVREYAEAGNGSVIIFGCPWGACDEYGRGISFTEVGWDTWAIKNRDSSYMGGSCDEIRFYSDFANITSGTNITITGRKPDAWVAWKKSNLADGITVIANATKNSDEYIFLAKNASGNVYVTGMYGWKAGSGGEMTYPIQECWDRIFYALFKDAGIISGDGLPRRIIEIDHSDKGYAIFIQHDNVTDNYSVNLTKGITDGHTYALYQLNPHENQTSLSTPVYIGTYTSAQIKSGISLEFKPYQNKLVRIVDVSEPDYVLPKNGSITSSTWTSANSTRQVKLFGVQGDSAELTVYWRTMNTTIKIKFANGTVVNAEDYYSTISKLVELPFTFQSEETISIYVETITTVYLTSTFTDGGISSPSGSNLPYSTGSVVSVTATHEGYFVFSHWLLDAENVGSANPYSFVITNNRTLQAVFYTAMSWNFKDKDTNNVDAHVTWQLLLAGSPISYVEGKYTLAHGDYTVEASYKGNKIKSKSFTTGSYNSMDVNLEMKPHTTVSGGYLAFNSTLTSLTVDSQTNTNLTFTPTGSGAFQVTVDVPQNASYVQKDGSNQTYGSVWTYDSTQKTVVINSTLSSWELAFPPPTPPSPSGSPYVEPIIEEVEKIVTVPDTIQILGYVFEKKYAILAVGIAIVAVAVLIMFTGTDMGRRSKPRKSLRELWRKTW